VNLHSPNVSSSALLHRGPKNDLLEGAFIDRYTSLLKWALQLTQGDQAAAEDLVHDAYFQFCRSGQSLGEIQNLDGYLYSVLKYLHQSNLKRTARFPLKVLSPIEYNNVVTSLQIPATDDGLSVQNDLRLLSSYLLSRKGSVKGASLLLLRFFHGYLPTDATCRPTTESLLTSCTVDLRVWKKRSSCSRVVIRVMNLHLWPPRQRLQQIVSRI
jgi:DNA-directed RNA polymerase specialized sigma24 family protein